MNKDELQVLGKRRKLSKREKWMITHDMPTLLMVDDETNDTIKISEDNIRSIRESQHDEE